MRKKIISAMLICAGFPVGSLYAVHPAPVTRIQSVQQNGACTGVVKDASGEAVIGASVTVDGTTNGTITDLDGNFSLPNVPKGSTIKISFCRIQDIGGKMEWFSFEYHPQGRLGNVG